MVESVLQLKCSCNNYPWGKQGSESLAARLASKTPGTDFKLENDKPYSEMWFGTYPDLPSYVLATGEDLQDVLKQNPEKLLGKTIMDKFEQPTLPYLPKILSIAKALPLQLHPNKSLAEKLHKEDPSNFTDPNHKPEIALALSDFEAFCGFKPLKEIEPLFQLEPLAKFLPGDSKSGLDDQILKSIVKNILNASEDTISKTEDELAKLPKEQFGKATYIPELLPRLQKQYDKTDPGTLVALITMSYLKLKAGQAIYIPADGIHAYLSGDIVECMARSNNVLNTGFCPAADRNSVDLFTSVLTFTPHSAEESILPEKGWKRARNGKTKLYDPPLSEFSMLALDLQNGESEVWPGLDGPGMLIVTNGDGELKANGKSFDLKEGFIYFIGQQTEVSFSAQSDLKAFMAFAE